MGESESKKQTKENTPFNGFSAVQPTADADGTEDSSSNGRLSIPNLSCVCSFYSFCGQRLFLSNTLLSFRFKQL